MIQPDITAAAGLEALEPAQRRALAQKLLALADDELILAHRNSEWCGHAPILEEDIAFANLAQDELGHAVLWYTLLQQLDGEDPDHLVYFRRANAFRNVRLVELPNGDWAFSILRQYLFDCYELYLLQALSSSTLEPVSHVAAKMRREELYHLRHTTAWVQRLGLGTDESRRRMQAALNALWPYTAQLFAPLQDEGLLVDAAIVPAPTMLSEGWKDHVIPFLIESGLSVPADIAPEAAPDGRDVHTEHLSALIEELQSVARSDPDASW